MQECPHCRRPLSEPVGRFCPFCGGDLQAAPPPPAPPWAPAEPPAGPPPAPSWGVPPSRPEPPRGAGTPWERRREIGFGTALVETTKRVLGSPRAFFRGMNTSGGIGPPLLYAVIVGYVGLLATVIYDAILRGVLGSPFGYWRGSDQLERIMSSMHWGANLAIQAVFGPVFVVIGLFIFAGIVHLMLLLLGGAKSGFEGTLRVSAYSEAAMLLGIVPLCGSLLSVVLYLILAIIGLGEAHRIGKGKAALAVLLPLLLLCCCCGVALAVTVGGLASALGRMS